MKRRSGTYHGRSRRRQILYGGTNGTDSGSDSVQLPAEIHDIILNHIGGPWRREEHLLRYHGVPPPTGLVPSAFLPTRNAHEVFAVQCNRKVRPWDHFFTEVDHLVPVNERQTFLLRALPYLMDLTDVSPEGKGRLVLYEGEEPDAHALDYSRKQLRMADDEPIERMMLSIHFLRSAMTDHPMVVKQLISYVRNPGYFLYDCYDLDEGRGVDDPNDPVEYSYLYQAGRFGFDLHQALDDFEDVYRKYVSWLSVKAFIALGWQDILEQLLEQGVLVVTSTEKVKFLRDHGVRVP